MNARRWLLVSTTLGTCLLWLACAGSLRPTKFTNPRFDFGFVEKIAVLSLENLSNDQQAGEHRCNRGGFREIEVEHGHLRYFTAFTYNLMYFKDISLARTRLCSQFTATPRLHEAHSQGTVT